MNRLSPTALTILALVVIIIVMVVVFSKETKPKAISTAELEANTMDIPFTEGSVYLTCKKELLDFWPILSTLAAFWLGGKRNGRK